MTIHLKHLASGARTPLPNLAIEDARAIRPALDKTHDLVLVEVTEHALDTVPPVAEIVTPAGAEPLTSPALTPASTNRKPLTDHVVETVLQIVVKADKRGATSAKFRAALPEGTTHGQIRYARELLLREGKIRIKGTKGNAKYFTATAP